MSDLRTTLFILRYRLAAFRRWLRVRWGAHDIQVSTVAHEG